jgi:hypothetical protein
VIAGAGIAATMQTANASIVHVTPNGSPVAVDGPTGVFDVDLDGDTVNDFTFTVDLAEIRVATPGTNAVVMSFGNTYADRLPGGVALPGGLNFIGGPSGQALAFGYYSSFQFGPWVNNQGGFLGLRFNNASGTHYGWLQGAGDVASEVKTFTITDWAYESCPGVGISTGATSGGGACDSPGGQTPEPSTMGLLALGALGLPLLRRRKARQ